MYFDPFYRVKFDLKNIKVTHFHFNALYVVLSRKKKKSVEEIAMLFIVLKCELFADSNHSVCTKTRKL